MGYYTTYYLVLEGPEEDKLRLKKELSRKLSNSSEALDTLFTDGYVIAKLYNLAQEIHLIAHKYPKLLIVLQGSGEEALDVWDYRWKGVTCECRNAKMPELLNDKLMTQYEKTEKEKIEF